MLPMTFRPIYLPALLVAVLGSGCDVRVGDNGVSLDVAGGKATDEWTRTYTVASGGSVDVVNVNGPIVVEAAKGRQVEIRATRVARARSDEEARAILKNAEIQEEVAPGRVALRTIASTAATTFGGRSLNVEYRVRVPAGLRVSLKTENGGIGLYDVNGVVAATITNGGVRGTNVSGAVSAHVVNGGIVMDIARIEGPIELDSVNGGIRVDIPADLNADVEASAVNGGVAADDGLRLQTSQRTRTKIIGKLNGGGPRLSVTTVNGGVRLRTRDGSVSRDAEGGDEAGEVVLEQGR
jgi:hypothetical protein